MKSRLMVVMLSSLFFELFATSFSRNRTSQRLCVVNAIIIIVTNVSVVVIIIYSFLVFAAAIGSDIISISIVVGSIVVVVIVVCGVVVAASVVVRRCLVASRAFARRAKRIALLVASGAGGVVVVGTAVSAFRATNSERTRGASMQAVVGCRARFVRAFGARRRWRGAARLERHALGLD